jgi:hypothetical protein
MMIAPAFFNRSTTLESRVAVVFDCRKRLFDELTTADFLVGKKLRDFAATSVPRPPRQSFRALPSGRQRHQPLRSAGGEGDRRKSEDQPQAKAAARESHLEFSCFLQGLS